MPLSDQLKQLAELHKVVELAMKGLIVQMWPGEPLPDSYFGLIKRMVNAYPRLEVIKQSVCIVGARFRCQNRRISGRGPELCV